MVPSITGGVQKHSAKWLDLLMRDAVHAAANRAYNIAVNGDAWARELKAVEGNQIKLRISQCRAASVMAIADRDLTAVRWEAIESHLYNAESSLAAWDFTGAHQALQMADELLCTAWPTNQSGVIGPRALHRTANLFRAWVRFRQV
jgi:hypothetical protein